jgi:hypothetical protein
MKITLDQEALRQAVIGHLQGVGVAANILKVDFRYTRVPYAVFAEVELSESKLHLSKPPATVVEREVVPPVPLVDPDNLPPMESTDTDDTTPVESSTPNGPLFGD